MKKTILLIAATVFLCSSAASAQTVYYNTEGGRYYHADSHCYSISEKYWNSMAEITQEQAQQIGLKGPCERCVVKEAASIADEVGGAEGSILNAPVTLEYSQEDQVFYESSFENACKSNSQEYGLYYYNEQYGEYYHTTKMCGAIDSLYENETKEIGFEQLYMGTYENLQLCDQCCEQDEPARIRDLNADAELFSKSIEENKHEIRLNGNCTYVVGTDIPEGLYTIVAEKKGSRFSVAVGGMNPEVYEPEELSTYVFYLSNGSVIHMEDFCSISSYKQVWLFQKNSTYNMKCGRYSICLQIPTMTYTVYAMDGEDASIVLYNYDAKTGIEESEIIKLAQNDAIRIRLSYADGRFIEFKNCIVELEEVVG